MKNIHISYYKTKIGELIIGSFERKLCILDFRYRKKRMRVDNRVKRLLNAEFIEFEDEIISQAKSQIDEYLKGERRSFDIPIVLVGTDFQQQVWNELLKIPYGKTASYLDIAKGIHHPKAVRAVASANGANAIAFLVPCHRVISSDGSLGGYGGGVAVKKRLLEMEGFDNLFTNQKHSVGE